MEEVKTVEDIYKSIGGFGRFQFFAICTILYPEFSAGMLEMLPIFTSSIPIAWNCSEPDDVSSLSSGLTFTCECTGNKSGSDVTLVDEEKSSIVSEWVLICQDAWIPDFITSVQMAGMLCGDFGGAYLNDKIGRKKALYFYVFLMMLSSLASAVVEHVILYGIARFLVGGAISAYLILSSVYPIEFLTPKWRSMSRGVGPWGEGILVMVLCAYYFRSWRLLTLVTSSTCAIFFLTYPFLLESPRWLMMKRKDLEAKGVFNKIASWNKRKPVPDIKLDGFMANAFVELETAEPEMSLRSLVKNSHVLCKTLIFMVLWFTSCLIYYGIAFNAKNLSGDLYRNALWMALVDMLGFRTAGFVSKCIGRRRSFILYMGAGAGALSILILMELGIGVPHDDNIFTALSLFAKAMSAGSITVIDCFTSESYSTEARSTAVGIANGAASVGSILAPQMALLGSISRSLPYFIFGGFAVSSTALIFLLRETKGTPLPQ